MDREVVPRLCRICDWLLNFGLHQGTKCHSDDGVRGLQRMYFKVGIIH